MPYPALFPVLSAAALAAGLVGLAARVNLQRRRAPPLPPAAAAPAAGVVVLLPVRDEEDEVEGCLDTLAAQTAAPRIVVIDDGSTDRTAERVEGAARRHPGRIERIAAGPLPPGWRGKVHALAAGLAHVEQRPPTWPGQEGPALAGGSGRAQSGRPRPAPSTSPPGAPPGARAGWVLSTDADTRHHPETLARALAAAAGRRLDCVSLAGRQEAVGVGENLLTPAAFALLDGLLGDWRAAAAAPVGVGARPVANGQFMLVRAAALDAVGGFAAVRDAAVDDVALAAALARGGFCCGFFRAPELLGVRMYRGAAEAARGWRRNLGGLFGPRPGAAAAALATLALPPAALAALAAAGRPLAAAAIWAGGAAASALLRAGSGHRPAWGLAWPLDALALATVLAAGVADWRRGALARWKGREMRVALDRRARKEPPAGAGPADGR